MSASDKTKLDGVASGATANSADATLLDRANHTGTQTASTISDFNASSRAQTEAMLIAGTGITLTPASSGATRTITVASSVSGSGPTIYTLANNAATGANTTPINVTGLVFSYEANSTYKIELFGRVQPVAATTGCGFQFDLSSAVTIINFQFFHQLANSGSLAGGHSIADDASVGVSTGMPGTSTYPVAGFGMLVTGANTGTAQLRFRAEVAAVTTLLAGTRMLVEKIA
jgi:hypothetical protein